MPGRLCLFLSRGLAVGRATVRQTASIFAESGGWKLGDFQSDRQRVRIPPLHPVFTASEQRPLTLSLGWRRAAGCVIFFIFPLLR
jgi:hypothetical protein